MMKKTLSVSLLVMCSLSIPAMAQNDAKAKTILQNVSKKVNGLKSLKADFSLHLSGGKVNETKKGTFTMKGQKYHVMLSGQEIICDTKTIWTYNKDANEVQVNKYDPNEQTISPAKLFTDFYDKEYSYKYIGEKKISGKNCDIIEMLPIGKNKQFTKIDIDIDKATTMVTGGNVWDKNGSQYQYNISNVKTNENVADNTFSFDAKAHPGVDVVDLR